MNLVRKYKISKILHQPLTGMEGEIIEFIKGWLYNLIPFKTDEYPDSIYYMSSKGLYVFSEGLYVLEQNTKSAYIYVRWKDFWEVLETKYYIEYKDIQDIIKFMVEEAFKQKVKTPSLSSGIASFVVEEAFKQKVKTPNYFLVNTSSMIEEAFKQNKI